MNFIFICFPRLACSDFMSYVCQKAEAVFNFTPFPTLLDFNGVPSLISPMKTILSCGM